MVYTVAPCCIFLVGGVLMPQINYWPPRRRQNCEEQKKTDMFLIHTLASATTFGFRDVVPTVQAL